MFCLNVYGVKTRIHKINKYNSLFCANKQILLNNSSVVREYFAKSTNLSLDKFLPHMIKSFYFNLKKLHSRYISDRRLKNFHKVVDCFLSKLKILYHIKTYKTN